MVKTYSIAEARDNLRVDLEELNFDPDEIFRDVRDQSPGRDFNW